MDLLVHRPRSNKAVWSICACIERMCTEGMCSKPVVVQCVLCLSVVKLEGHRIRDLFDTYDILLVSHCALTWDIVRLNFDEEART
jgi:hypothetical protein